MWSSTLHASQLVSLHLSFSVCGWYHHHWRVLIVSFNNLLPSIASPMASSTKLSKVLDLTMFRSIVGSLQYATVTRHEISYAINRCANSYLIPLKTIRKQWNVCWGIYKDQSIIGYLLLQSPQSYHCFLWCRLGI